MYSKSLTRPAVRASMGPLLVLARRHGSQQLRLLSGLSSSTPQGTKGIPSAVTLPPHSLLPTKILLRSLLIATVSSHRALLAPSLVVLSFLSESRSTLFSIEKNPILYALFKRTMYNHFCAGENEREVTSTIRGIKDMGFKGVILTYAREVVIDASTEERATGADEVKSKPDDGSAISVDQAEMRNDESIEAWRSGVLETVGMIGESDVLAIKFTGAGTAVADALKAARPLPKQMILALHEVCEEAIRRKAMIFIDAEQQFVQPGIDNVAMELMRKYNRDGSAIVYNTYQAYLKCTPDVLHKHLHQAQAEGFIMGVKLVRGAYINSEPRHLINDTKQDTDNGYDRIAMDLLSGRYRDMSPDGESRMPALELFLATHNRESSLKAYETQRSRACNGFPLTPVFYGQLLGMADEVSCTLLQLKGQDLGAPRYVSPESYKCLSWGTVGDCTSYLMRRAMENRDAVSRTRTEYVALRREVWRRIVGLFRLKQN